MKALKIHKAAPDEGREERNINGGIKNMKKSKGMQLGAMLAVILLVSLAFVVGVNAQGLEAESK